MKVSKLSDAALDWAVAEAEGINNDPDMWVWGHYIGLPFSTRWHFGGPIIEREKIELRNWGTESWIAQIVGTQSADSPLVAAMRCYVASKFGDEIELPKELYESEETT